MIFLVKRTNVRNFVSEMKKVLYLHGFASSGSSGTATTMRNLLYPKGAGVLSPDIPVNPPQALQFVVSYTGEIRPDLIVATSMGCLYAEQMYGIPRILVNPSFHMSKTLTFMGLGKREFRNKREDGSKSFKVDKEMIKGFAEVERLSFAHIDDEERRLVWGLFGTRDRLVNCQQDFVKNYGSAQEKLFDGEHFLNDKVLSKEVMPLVEKILGL